MVGITPQAMNLLRMFDVNMVVCGSYLSTQETIQESICMLRFGHLSYELEVRHFYGESGVCSQRWIRTLLSL